MGAHVERGLDTLGRDHLGLQVLRVIHPVAGIADPARRMHVHHMTHIDDFHCCSRALGFLVVSAGDGLGCGRYLSKAETASCSSARMRSAEPEGTMLGSR